MCTKTGDLYFMKLFRSLIFALSMYTRVPVRLKNLTEEDTAHSLVFLPLAGALTGGLMYGFFVLPVRRSLPSLTMVCVLSLLPLLVTGGFHVDGYMDTLDAISSLKSREEKLNILKDPHIGAFAVIRLLMLAGVWTGSLSVLVESENEAPLYVHMLSFFTVRAACGVLASVLPKAKKEGMLVMEVRQIKKADVAALLLQLVIGCVLMAAVCPPAGLTACVALFGFMLYYRWLCLREFGGVTGDTSGYFVTGAEMLIVFTLAVSSVILRS